MQADINGGNRGEFEADNYFHNMKIDAIFQKARKQAWASIMNDPRIQDLIKVQRQKKRTQYLKKRQTQTLTPVLQMRNK